MAAAAGLYFDVDEEDGADEDGAEEKGGESTDPQNRALPDILKIVSVFLPSVGKDGQLLATDIPDRLKQTFFKGDGTLKMHKNVHKRRYKAANIRQKVTQVSSGPAGSEKRYAIVDLLRRLRIDSEGKMVIKADFWYDFLRPQYKRHGRITASNKEYLRDLCALDGATVYCLSPALFHADSLAAYEQYRVVPSEGSSSRVQLPCPRGHALAGVSEVSRRAYTNKPVQVYDLHGTAFLLSTSIECEECIKLYDVAKSKNQGFPSPYQKTYCVHENVCAGLPIDCRPPLDFSLGGTKGGQKLMTVPLVRAMFERNSIPALHKTLETMHNQEHVSRVRVYKTIIDDARKISKSGGGERWTAPRPWTGPPCSPSPSFHRHRNRPSKVALPPSSISTRPSCSKPCTAGMWGIRSTGTTHSRSPVSLWARARAQWGPSTTSLASACGTFSATLRACRRCSRCGSICMTA